ncbi:hypothetical protein R2083_08325 [Nitrosomonas sp. Is35]|uniref:hypothetical protein n=1 Tax=Nitrosomonas sp. Is35 TaxID=3080534 RepID=UPI00294AB982|nr:hypothetical protein [Nitrosomonas sp. Is35]MDV6347519.1 hypothetical protein [Nitrosomonas sp. Is35]
MTRKVIVYEMVLNGDTRRRERTPTKTGIFHQWGLILEQDDRGFSNESVAIVELDDGNIITPRADLIQFVKDEARLGVGDKVILYDRYNFAIPVKGVINKLIPENNSAVVNLTTTNNPHYPVGSDFYALTKQLEIDAQ